MKTRLLSVLCVIFILLIIVVGCTKATPISPAANTPTPTASIITQEPVVVEAPSETPPSTGPIPDANALPPEPRAVTITTSDGITLDGYYYPSAQDNAPLVIMMHWMMGDKADWNEIAVWLQNRGQANPFPNPGDPVKFPWWDPAWFPKVPADDSYAVLVFTYRGCLPFDQGGCQTIDDAGRLQDSYDAMLFGGSLEGIDPNRIAVIGSSIGADGAADGCLYLNQQFPNSCQGSLSLSPGDWLGVSYGVTVKHLVSLDPPVQAWCVADEKEYGVCEAAQGMANSDDFKPFRVVGGDHGNMLLRPNLTPLPMNIILDFLVKTLH